MNQKSVDPRQMNKFDIAQWFAARVEHWPVPEWPLVRELFKTLDMLVEEDESGFWFACPSCGRPAVLYDDEEMIRWRWKCVHGQHHLADMDIIGFVKSVRNCSRDRTREILVSFVENANTPPE